MKKFFFFAAAVIMMAAGCQKQELNPVTDGDTTVTFTVSTGEIATKAIADGTNIDVLYWEIYQDLDEKALGEGKVQDDDGNKEFTVELKLLADQEYNIVFWAQVDGQNHYVVDDLRSVKINTYKDEMANDETRAAFFAVHNFSTENGVAIKEDVILRRPFSQLNLGATTLETSLNLVNNGQLEVKTTQVVVTNIATSFNTVAGEGEGEQAVTFQHAKTPVDYTQQLLTVNGETYHWLGMNYLIVNGEADNVVVDIEVETSVGKVNHTVSNVPIKENYRTNILGNLLTTGAEFTVIIDEKFDGDYYGPEFMKTPAYDESTKTWTIAEYYEFVWFADQVNNKGNEFEGKTVKLATDIDLKGEPWTPLGATGTIFKGTFEGAQLTKGGEGYPTISNLTVKTEGKASAGLFANCRGYIKNLNLVNVNITGQYKTGAVVGDGLCAKIENCHVDGLEMLVTPYNENEANNVGGIVGYLSAEPTAYVKNCSVKNANITAYRKVGGIVGAANGKSEVTGNTVSETKVKADQTSAYNEVKAADAGAVVGYAHPNAVVEPNTKGDGVEVVVILDSSDELSLAGNGYLFLEDGEYGLTSDLNVKGALQIENGAEVVLDAEGNSIVSGSAADYGFIVRGEGSSLVLNDANIDSKGGAIAADEGAKVTMNSGSVAVNSTSTSGRYNVYAVGEGTEVTINGGVFSFSKTLNQKRAYIYCGAGATVYVKGGTFGKASTRSGYTAGILGDGKVIITGGTFGFDPTKWVAYGYTAKKVGENWVVVAPAANNDEFQEALKNAKAGDVIYIAGTGVLPSSIVTSPAGELTIEGVSEDAEVSFNTKAGGADGGLNCYADGMDLVFKNVKVVSPNTGSAYTGGFGRAKSVLFDNCEYYGQYRSLSYVKFNQCTIDPQTSYIYTDYSNADFVNCVFNCSEGKGIQVYNDGNSTETTINVTKCTFEAAKHGATWDGKPVTAIDINSNGEKFIVNITETTATGFPVGLTTGYSLFNIKGGAEYVTVYVDGNKYIAEGLMEDAEGNQVASTEAGLKEALENGGTVVLANPFTIDQSESNGYGKTGINMTNGGTLDGNGNELGAPGSTGTWDSAINTSGGTIKNIKVTKGFRGIFIKNSSHNEKLYLDNVTIDGTTYTISCDQGNGLGLEATNSTFKGWTSYAATLGNAKFTDCYFGYGNGYSYCRPYAPTEFVGCEFEAGLVMDPRAAVTFENCTLDGVALTSENLATLVTDTAKATIK